MKAFFCRIGQDGHAYPADQVIPIRTLYFVESVIIPEKTTPTWKCEYYTAHLQDAERRRAADNTLEWQGIRCRVEERDHWVSDEEKKKFKFECIALATHVTDRGGKTEFLLFDNNRHDGAAWLELLAYVRELAGVDYHRNVQVAQQLRLRSR